MRDVEKDLRRIIEKMNKNGLRKKGMHLKLKKGFSTSWIEFHLKSTGPNE